MQKRIAAFQTQRLLASEPSMGMRNLSAQVSLSGTLKSYQLPSMQTLPELPSIARPRRNARCPQAPEMPQSREV